MDSIPIIDFNLISDFEFNLKEEKSVPMENWNTLADHVYQALSQIGFMYIINHGIPAEKIELAFEQSEIFFNQPKKMKDKYLIDLSKSYEGYTKPGQETFTTESSHEFRESFSLVRPDEWFEMQHVPRLVPALQQLRKECQLPVRKLWKLIATALGLDDIDHFIKHYNGGELHQNPDSAVQLSTVRTHFYPALPQDIDIPKNSVRCSEHTDYGALTFLFQDSLGGLEVKALNNKWIPANPIAGSVLVNTGDVLEFWTNGLFPATPHRVLIPDEEIQKRTKRQSIAFFIDPDNETMIHPLNSLSNPSAKLGENEQKPRQPVKFLDYFKSRMNQTYGYT